MAIEFNEDSPDEISGDFAASDLWVWDRCGLDFYDRLV
jgi:hypothetical protein